MQGCDDKISPENKAAFWKKNTHLPGSIQRVYGAMHPPCINVDSRPSTPKKDGNRLKHKRNSSTSSFKDFQDSTNDAWDIDDDDFCLSSADVKISSKVAESTAMTVITNHSERFRGGSGNASTKSYEAKLIAMQRLATQRDPQPYSNSASTGSLPIPGPGLGIRQTSMPSVPRSTPDLYYTFNVPDREAVKLEKFKTLLKSSSVEIDDLRELCWSGIPPKFRPMSWKLLAGYLPANTDRRESTLERKREEYFNYVRNYYDKRHEEFHQETYRQIHIDIPRMSPLVPLFQQEVVQQVFERILYIWAIRHPASGYVQGMNDLVTPFFVVFLHELVPEGVDVESYNVSEIPTEKLQPIEADSFWCMSKLLDGIQDNYTFAQPGIQRQVQLLKDLVQRIDVPLHEHLNNHTVEFLQFSFRWMNNLLMRELPLRCTIRLWDTYLSEPDGFSSFHLYVCAAFLTYWSKDLLRERDFQGLMLMLQNLPTLHWGNEEISLLLADAFRLKFMFADAPNHLQPIKK